MHPTVYDPTVKSLKEKIESTNNGYLFAPAFCEIELARKHTEIFKIVAQKPICGSSYRIYLK